MGDWGVIFIPVMFINDSGITNSDDREKLQWCEGKVRQQRKWQNGKSNPDRRDYWKDW